MKGHVPCQQKQKLDLLLEGQWILQFKGNELEYSFTVLFLSPLNHMSFSTVFLCLYF